MTSKYQKVSFNKEKLLKMKEFTTEDNKGHKQFIDYSKLKLAIISKQLCFVDPNDCFMPIARISTIKDIIEKENNQYKKDYENEEY